MAETEVHTVRVARDLWHRALARARRDDTTLSALIRDWLTEYVAGEENANVHEEMRCITARLTRLAEHMKR